MTRDQLIETVARAICRTWWSVWNHPESAEEDENENWQNWIGEAANALTALEAAGMRVVPVEPTIKIIAEGTHTFDGTMWGMGRAYRAMVLAAQEDSTSE